MAISEKWQNYIRFLIFRTGDRVDELSDVVGSDVRKGIHKLETQHAQYITTMLKQEKLWLESGSVTTLPNAAFEIETSYNTTMMAETSEELLLWAEKRFKDAPLSLKQIKEFLVEKRRSTITVSGYKIRRAT